MPDVTELRLVCVPWRVVLIRQGPSAIHSFPRGESGLTAGFQGAARHSQASGHSRAGASHGVLQVITRTLQSTQARTSRGQETEGPSRATCDSRLYAVQAFIRVTRSAALA